MAYEDDELVDYSPYRPSPLELSTVAELQRQGAPKNVKFLEATSKSGPYAGWVTRIVRFTGANGKVHDADSRFLVAFPQMDFTSMRELGMIQGLAPTVRPDPVIGPI
jgi:hypothetical protein